eukprot:207975-Pelagomonas_calceolata.AAC.1
MAAELLMARSLWLRLADLQLLGHTQRRVGAAAFDQAYADQSIQQLLIEDGSKGPSPLLMTFVAAQTLPGLGTPVSHWPESEHAAFARLVAYCWASHHGPHNTDAS